MFNETMIEIFLKETHLSEPVMPTVWKDVALVIDLTSERSTDVEKLAASLSNTKAKELYRTTILAWLLEVPRLTHYSWGWYRNSDAEEYRLLPIAFSFKKHDFDDYHIKGSMYSPYNMLLFMEHKDVYSDLLEAAVSVCESFVSEYRTYEHIDIPIDMQTFFVAGIMQKCREMREALRLVRK